MCVSGPHAAVNGLEDPARFSSDLSHHLSLRSLANQVSLPSLHFIIWNADNQAWLADLKGCLGINCSKRSNRALQGEKCYTRGKDYYGTSVFQVETASSLRVLSCSKSGIWPAQKENCPRNKSTCPFPLSNADDNRPAPTQLTPSPGVTRIMLPPPHLLGSCCEPSTKNIVT